MASSSGTWSVVSKSKDEQSQGDLKLEPLSREQSSNSHTFPTADQNQYASPQLPYSKYVVNPLNHNSQDDNQKVSEYLKELQTPQKWDSTHAQEHNQDLLSDKYSDAQEDADILNNNSKQILADPILGGISVEEYLAENPKEKISEYLNTLKQSLYTSQGINSVASIDISQQNFVSTVSKQNGSKDQCRDHKEEAQFQDSKSSYTSQPVQDMRGETIKEFTNIKIDSESSYLYEAQISQPRYITPKSEVSINILIAGQKGIGKTTFSQMLLYPYAQDQDFYVNSQKPHIEIEQFLGEHNQDYENINKIWQQFETAVQVNSHDDLSSLKYSIQELPFNLSDQSIDLVVQYLIRKREDACIQESINAQQLDIDLDLCIYLLPPSGDVDKDVEYVQTIGSFLPTLPVIAKSETLENSVVGQKSQADSELARRKEEIIEKLRKSGAKYLQPTEFAWEENLDQKPILAVAAAPYILKDNLFQAIREYPYGDCPVMRPDISDSLLLKRLIFEKGVDFLKNATQARHAQYRSSRLQNPHICPPKADSPIPPPQKQDGPQICPPKIQQDSPVGLVPPQASIQDAGVQNKLSDQVRRIQELEYKVSTHAQEKETYMDQCQKHKEEIEILQRNIDILADRQFIASMKPAPSEFEFALKVLSDEQLEAMEKLKPSDRRFFNEVIEDIVQGNGLDMKEYEKLRANVMAEMRNNRRWYTKRTEEVDRLQRELKSLQEQIAYGQTQEASDQYHDTKPKSEFMAFGNSKSSDFIEMEAHEQEIEKLRTYYRGQMDELRNKNCKIESEIDFYEHRLINTKSLVVKLVKKSTPWHDIQKQIGKYVEDTRRGSVYCKNQKLESTKQCRTTQSDKEICIQDGGNGGSRISESDVSRSDVSNSGLGDSEESGSCFESYESETFEDAESSEDLAFDLSGNEVTLNGEVVDLEQIDPGTGKLIKDFIRRGEGGVWDAETAQGTSKGAQGGSKRGEVAQSRAQEVDRELNDLLMELDQAKYDRSSKSFLQDDGANILGIRIKKDVFGNIETLDQIIGLSFKGNYSNETDSEYAQLLGQLKEASEIPINTSEIPISSAQGGLENQGDGEKIEGSSEVECGKNIKCKNLKCGNLKCKKIKCKSIKCESLKCRKVKIHGEKIYDVGDLDFLGNSQGPVFCELCAASLNQDVTSPILNQGDASLDSQREVSGLKSETQLEKAKFYRKESKKAHAKLDLIRQIILNLFENEVWTSNFSSSCKVVNKIFEQDVGGLYHRGTFNSIYRRQTRQFLESSRVTDLLPQDTDSLRQTKKLITNDLEQWFKLLQKAFTEIIQKGVGQKFEEHQLVKLFKDHTWVHIPIFVLDQLFRGTFESMLGVAIQDGQEIIFNRLVGSVPAGDDRVDVGLLRQTLKQRIAYKKLWVLMFKVWQKNGTTMDNLIHESLHRLLRERGCDVQDLEASDVEVSEKKDADVEPQLELDDVKIKPYSDQQKFRNDFIDSFWKEEAELRDEGKLGPLNDGKDQEALQELPRGEFQGRQDPIDQYEELAFAEVIRKINLQQQELEKEFAEGKQQEKDGQSKIVMQEDQSIGGQGGQSIGGQEKGEGTSDQRDEVIDQLQKEIEEEQNKIKMAKRVQQIQEGRHKAKLQVRNILMNNGNKQNLDYNLFQDLPVESLADAADQNLGAAQTEDERKRLNLQTSGGPFQEVSNESYVEAQPDFLSFPKTGNPQAGSAGQPFISSRKFPDHADPLTLYDYLETVENDTSLSGVVEQQVPNQGSDKRNEIAEKVGQSSGVPYGQERALEAKTLTQKWEDAYENEQSDAVANAWIGKYFSEMGGNKSGEAAEQVGRNSDRKLAENSNSDSWYFSGARDDDVEENMPRGIIKGKSFKLTEDQEAKEQLDNNQQGQNQQENAKTYNNNFIYGVQEIKDQDKQQFHTSFDPPLFPSFPTFPGSTPAGCSNSNNVHLPINNDTTGISNLYDDSLYGQSLSTGGLYDMYQPHYIQRNSYQPAKTGMPSRYYDNMRVPKGGPHFHHRGHGVRRRGRGGGMYFDDERGALHNEAHRGPHGYHHGQFVPPHLRRRGRWGLYGRMYHGNNPDTQWGPNEFGMEVRPPPFGPPGTRGNGEPIAESTEEVVGGSQGQEKGVSSCFVSEGEDARDSTKAFVGEPSNLQPNYNSTDVRGPYNNQTWSKEESQNPFDKKIISSYPIREVFGSSTITPSAPQFTAEGVSSGATQAADAPPQQKQEAMEGRLQEVRDEYESKVANLQDHVDGQGQLIRKLEEDLKVVNEQDDQMQKGFFLQQGELRKQLWDTQKREEEVRKGLQDRNRMVEYLQGEHEVLKNAHEEAQNQVEALGQVVDDLNKEVSAKLQQIRDVEHQKFMLQDQLTKNLFYQRNDSEYLLNCQHTINTFENFMGQIQDDDYSQFFKENQISAMEFYKAWSMQLRDTINELLQKTGGQQGEQSRRMPRIPVSHSRGSEMDLLNFHEEASVPEVQMSNQSRSTGFDQQKDSNAIQNLTSHISNLQSSQNDQKDEIIGLKEYAEALEDNVNQLNRQLASSKDQNILQQEQIRHVNNANQILERELLDERAIKEQLNEHINDLAYVRNQSF